MDQMMTRKTGPWFFSGQSANEFYQGMLATIRLEGERASPRGEPTTELLHAVTRIEQPRRRVLSQYGRKLNPFFNLAEALWILRGESDARWICSYNAQLRKWLDPPMAHFHGAYGERIRWWPLVRQNRSGVGFRAEASPHRDQLMDCYYTLRDSPESRQAVIVLWNPMADHRGVSTLDRPCNDAIAFKVRGGALWMSVFNRSNDVVLGLTSTNIVQFSTLQEALATWLGVDVGPYTHYSDSLHLYDSQDVPTGPPFDVYDYVAPVAMVCQPPADFDQMLRDLYSWAAPEPPGRAVICSGGGEPELPGSVRCPYWASVGYALAAYRAHKLGNWPVAIAAVGLMLTPDWQVECLRFLADRHGGHADFQGKAAAVIGELSAGGGLEGRQALWQYVFQSHGAAVPSTC